MHVPAVERCWPDSAAGEDLATLQRRRPLTHCMMTHVTAAFAANVLLALGASPAMVIAEDEAPSFAADVDALLVNLGTLTPPAARAMTGAVAAVRTAGRPWVLDPVGAGTIPNRRQFALTLVAQRPAVIRGNGSEILSLAAAVPGGRGVDSTASAAAAVEAARSLATSSGAVVAVSGAVDYLTDGKTTFAVAGGHPLMARITGSGCALGATIAALLGAGCPPLRAATTASLLFAEAGRRAGRLASGTASFAVAFVDALGLLAAGGASAVGRAEAAG
jgi:hydroxyethylthiazole kinase